MDGFLPSKISLHIFAVSHVSEPIAKTSVGHTDNKQIPPQISSPENPARLSNSSTFFLGILVIFPSFFYTNKQFCQYLPLFCFYHTHPSFEDGKFIAADFLL